MKQIVDHFYMYAAFGQNKLLQGRKRVVWKVVCSCYHEPIVLLVFVTRSTLVCFVRREGKIQWHDAEQTKFVKVTVLEYLCTCVHCACECLWMHVIQTLGSSQVSSRGLGEQ